MSVIGPGTIVRMTRTVRVTTGPKTYVTLAHGQLFAVHATDAGMVRILVGHDEGAPPRIVVVPRDAVERAS